MESDAAILAECHRLALVVAPELQGAELYVCDSQTFEGLAVDGDNFHGFAMRLPTPQMVDRLANDWRGHGPVIALKLSAIRADFKPDFFTPCTLAIMLHEVAHLVPMRSKDINDRKFFAAMDCEELREVCDRQILEYTAHADRICGVAVDPEHDDRFIRRCGHLYYRARLAGYKVESGCLLGPACFGGQLPFWMMDLLPELHQLKDASFAEIEATSAPVAFTESWNLCVEQLKGK